MILVEPSHKSFPVNSANGELPKKTGYQKAGLLLSLSVNICLFYSDCNKACFFHDFDIISIRHTFGVWVRP